MRTCAWALIALSGCAQSVVSTDDRGPRDRDGSTSDRRDATDGDDHTEESDPDSGGADALTSDGPRADALPADTGGGNVGPCMRRFQEDIQVPGPAGLAGFQGVRALAFDSARRLYVLSRSGPPYVGWVTVVGPGPAHAFVRTFGRDRVHAAQDLVIDANGNALILDWDSNSSAAPVVHVYDAQGTFVRAWIADGGGNSDEAWSLVRDDSGRLYAGGLVMFRYDANGTYIDAIGRFGGEPGRIGLARGLAFDPRGYVWVADLARNRVHQYDVSTGSQVIEIGGRGAGPGQFDGDAAPEWRWGPTRVAIDGNGAIYANDPYAARIQKLSRQGTFLGEFSFGNSMEIGPVVVDTGTGSIYVGRGTAVAVVCAL